MNEWDQFGLDFPLKFRFSNQSRMIRIWPTFVERKSCLRLLEGWAPGE